MHEMTFQFVRTKAGGSVTIKGAAGAPIGYLFLYWLTLASDLDAQLPDSSPMKDTMKYVLKKWESVKERMGGI